jgi:hypothetical protein
LTPFIGLCTQTKMPLHAFGRGRRDSPARC